jgi:hypothetical protein
MYAFEIIAERKIREAMDRGEFDNLSMSGRPLPADGLENIPVELRMAYKILKNAGIIPEEAELKKSIHNLNQLIRACHESENRDRLRKELNAKQLRYNMLVERRTGRIADHAYYARIMEKLGS